MRLKEISSRLRQRLPVMKTICQANHIVLHHQTGPPIKPQVVHCHGVAMMRMVTTFDTMCILVLRHLIWAIWYQPMKHLVPIRVRQVKLTIGMLRPEMTLARQMVIHGRLLQKPIPQVATQNLRMPLPTCLKGVLLRAVRSVQPRQVTRCCVSIWRRWLSMGHTAVSLLCLRQYLQTTTPASMTWMLVPISTVPSKPCFIWSMVMA